MKKGIHWLVILISLIVFAGCASKQAEIANPDETSLTGRYVEYDVTPPAIAMKDMNSQAIDILGMFSFTDGNFDLLAAKMSTTENAKAELLHLRSVDSGKSWTSIDTSWVTKLQEQFGASVLLNIKRVAMDQSGRIFCILTTEDHTLRMAKVEESTVSEVLITDWQSHDFYKDLQMLAPQEFMVFPDGRFVITFGRNAPYTYIYDALGKQVKKIEASWYPMAFWADGYASIDYVKEQQSDMLFFYDYAGKNLSKSLFPYDPEMGCSHWAEDGRVFTVAKQGIASFSKDSAESKTVLDGSMYSLGNPSFQIVDFEYCPQYDEFYVAIKNSLTGNVKLLRYVYDSTLPMVSSNNITVFTLNDSDTLRQAISVYQTKYPDCTVTMEIGMSEETAVTKDDIIRVLNTELQAKKGPDIIILNGLPATDYMEKGVLADLSDIVDSEEFFSNIAQAYRKGSSVNAIPVRFQIPILTGDRTLVNGISDIKKMADESIQHPADKNNINGKESTLPQEKRPLAYVENTADLCKLFIYTYQTALLRPDYTIDCDKLSELLVATKTIYEQCSSFGLFDRGYQPTILDEITSFRPEEAYGEKTLLGMANARDFMDCFYWALSKPAENGTKFISPELYMVPLCGPQTNVFTPSILAAVNVSSPHQDDARAFIRILLSEDVQTPAYSEGFPVNRKAFFTALADSKDTLKVQYATDMEQLVTSLTTPVIADETLLAAILTETESYYKNKKSLEETVGNITSKLHIYLAEKS